MCIAIPLAILWVIALIYDPVATATYTVIGAIGYVILNSLFNRLR